MSAPQPNVNFLLGIPRRGSLVAIVSALTARLVGAIAPGWSARTWQSDTAHAVLKVPEVLRRSGRIHLRRGIAIIVALSNQRLSRPKKTELYVDDSVAKTAARFHSFQEGRTSSLLILRDFPGEIPANAPGPEPGE
jgi:hypothetical protein